MKILIKPLLLLVLATAGKLASADVLAEVFGDPMPTSPPPVSLSAAIVRLETSGQPVESRVSGRITEVCQKKGCWMVLTDGSLYARVTFKDYGFFVPKDSGQHEAVVLGTLSSNQLTAREANHYEKDAGRPERHAGSVTEYTIVASSVQFRSTAE